MSFSDTPFSQIRSLLKATALVQTNKNTSPIPQAFQEETLGPQQQSSAIF